MVYVNGVAVDRETAQKLGRKIKPDVFAIGNGPGYAEIHMNSGSGGVLKAQTELGFNNMCTVLDSLHRQRHPELY